MLPLKAAQKIEQKVLLNFETLLGVLKENYKKDFDTFNGSSGAKKHKKAVKSLIGLNARIQTGLGRDFQPSSSDDPIVYYEKIKEIEHKIADMKKTFTAIMKDKKIEEYFKGTLESFNHLVMFDFKKELMTGVSEHDFSQKTHDSAQKARDSAKKENLERYPDKYHALESISLSEAAKSIRDVIDLEKQQFSKSHKQHIEKLNIHKKVLDDANRGNFGREKDFRSKMESMKENVVSGGQTYGFTKEQISFVKNLKENDMDLLERMSLYKTLLERIENINKTLKHSKEKEDVWTTPEIMTQFRNLSNTLKEANVNKTLSTHVDGPVKAALRKMFASLKKLFAWVMRCIKKSKTSDNASKTDKAVYSKLSTKVINIVSELDKNIHDITAGGGVSRPPLTTRSKPTNTEGNRGFFGKFSNKKKKNT